MKTPTLLKTGPVPLSDVTIGKRLRPVSEAGIESLVVSITETQVMKDAIHLRKKKDGTFVLIAGAHRLEAALYGIAVAASDVNNPVVTA